MSWVKTGVPLVHEPSPIATTEGGHHPGRMLSADPHPRQPVRDRWFAAIRTERSRIRLCPQTPRCLGSATTRGSDCGWREHPLRWLRSRRVVATRRSQPSSRRSLNRARRAYSYRANPGHYWLKDRPLRRSQRSLRKRCRAHHLPFG